MQILQLKIANFMRIRAVEITPEGNVVEISGRNAQGKSSVLNAIWSVLGGKSADPERPVRKGADTASVVLDLGEYKVERTWTEDGNSYLSVRTSEGAKVLKPQTVLDGLLGNLSFDPLAFTRQDAKAQVATLAQVIGLDLDKIEGKKRAHYDERTLVNRELKQVEAQVAALPAPLAGVPDEEVEVRDLMGELEEAQDQIAENAEARRRAQHLKQELADHERRMADLRAQLADGEINTQRIGGELDVAEKKIEGLVDPDTDSIKANIADLGATNKAVRDKKQRLALQARVKDLSAKADELTGKIKDLDERKAESLQRSALPVKGLGFGEDGVTFNGMPLSQASSAEQLRVSTAIAMAINPKVRVALVHDGSLLDADSMRILSDMAGANDFQIWVEQLSDPTGSGVIIEDGLVSKVFAEAK